MFLLYAMNVHGVCIKPFNYLLVGSPAPEFTAQAVINGEFEDEFSLKNYKGSYVILVFYPLDFTFVCPTELQAFQEKLSAFAKRNAKIVACSIDSAYSHFAWLNTPKEMGGVKGVEYPLISDINKSISRSFQVLNEEAGVAYRGLFLIDREGVIRHQMVNDLPLGRNVDEVLRLLDALIAHEKSGEVCPANWQSGDPTLDPSADGLLDYFK
jgi:peroxiredoxin (alkyl hydroperoxide reductase subunit C)